MTKNENAFLDLSIKCRGINEVLNKKYFVASGDSRLGKIVAIAENLPDGGMKTISPYMKYECLAQWMDGMIWMYRHLNPDHRPKQK